MLGRSCWRRKAVPRLPLLTGAVPHKSCVWVVSNSDGRVKTAFLALFLFLYFHFMPVDHSSVHVNPPFVGHDAQNGIPMPSQPKYRAAWVPPQHPPIRSRRRRIPVFTSQTKRRAYSRAEFCKMHWQEGLRLQESGPEWLPTQST